RPIEFHERSAPHEWHPTPRWPTPRFGGSSVRETPPTCDSLLPSLPLELVSSPGVDRCWRWARSHVKETSSREVAFDQLSGMKATTEFTAGLRLTQPQWLM